MVNEYFSKREEKEKKHLFFQRKRKIKKVFLITSGILILAAGIWGLGKVLPSQSSSAVIAKRGIHWHPELSIKILGQKQTIPANIGLGFSENPIHTHDASGVIHLEFSGVVKENNIRLGRFFEIWGKKFNKDCILDKCSGPEGKLKMLVNGKDNFEFENYFMRDGDKIEIIFEM